MHDSGFSVQVEGPNNKDPSKINLNVIRFFMALSWPSMVTRLFSNKQVIDSKLCFY